MATEQHGQTEIGNEADLARAFDEIRGDVAHARYKGEGHGWPMTATIERFYESVGRFLRQQVVFT